MTSMIKGMLNEDEADDSEANSKSKEILVPYADNIVNSISTLF